MEQRRAYKVAGFALVVWLFLAIIAGSHGAPLALFVIGLICLTGYVTRRIGRFWNVLAVLAATSLFGVLPFLFMVGAGV